VTREEAVVAADAIAGTLVWMEMPWPHDVIGQLERYFQSILPPPNVRLRVNDKLIEPREPAHRVEATLPTELMESGKWIRPPRKTAIELMHSGEAREPMVYELGIPVCPAEWTQPYHVNVLQRVPMNPCRDAVASGYLVKLHRACLPVLLPEMEGQEVLQDWVGTAVPHCDQRSRSR